MRLFDQAKYAFIQNRRRAYMLSTTVILVGVVAMIVNVISIGSWQVYGVDFTGGSLIQVQFHEPSRSTSDQRSSEIAPIRCPVSCASTRAT